VVGFDGSPASHNALAYATGMARRLAEPLLIVHVAPPGIFCEPLTGMVVGSVTDREHMNRWLRGELLAACDIDGLDVRLVTRCGTPARELAAAATEYSADALIIGASGRPRRHLAGSVSGWLARHAQCPVIVVP
jgi:nucleotide-binding universal stress UspA family protein